MNPLATMLRSPRSITDRVLAIPTTIRPFRALKSTHGGIASWWPSDADADAAPILTEHEATEAVWRTKGMTMKQVIVMRNDLNMRKGKMIAQGAHAALGCVIGDDISVERLANYGAGVISVPALVRDWLAGGMKKICVRVESEEELLAIHAKAKERGIVSFLVTDAGHTEFNGPTNTCVAIGPDVDSIIDDVTGHLKLL